MTTSLKPEEKKFLLLLVRDIISRRIENKDFQSPDFYSPALRKERAAFVTLHEKKMLRGCIGYVEARRPLQQAVEELALAAAFEDPRFPPLQSAELKYLHIEISILSPLKTIKDIAEIEIGKHGLIIEKNFCRGLLLPQVAIEQKWDKITFLQQTCLKAGLPVTAWQDTATTISIFSAEIFSDEGLNKIGSEPPQEYP